MSDAVEAVETAMVAIRRGQSRRRIGGRAAAGSGLSPAAFQALDAVEEGEAAGVAVSGVAAALGVDQPRASRLVAALVEAGLVRRVADQADGRRSALARTAAGRRASARMHRDRQAVFGAAMAGWSAAERDDFARLLTRFAAALEP